MTSVEIKNCNHRVIALSPDSMCLYDNVTGKVLVTAIRDETRWTIFPENVVAANRADAITAMCDCAVKLIPASYAVVFVPPGLREEP